MDDCIFCKIIKGEIPSTKVFESESVLGFKDINPIAKVHMVFIHKEHTTDIASMTESNPEQITEVMKGITEYAKSDNSLKEGYRVITNKGPAAGQTVFHTHFHLLGGQRLSWG